MSAPKPVRARRLSDGALGWFMPARRPSFDYLPDGVFTPSETARAGAATIAWASELEIFEEEQST
jgi:hypothetical protein